MAMAHKLETRLTAQQRSQLDSLKNFSKNFAIAEVPAPDIIPLLARGEERQTAVLKTATSQASASGAKHPLPRFYSSTKSLVLLDSRIASDTMVPPKSSTNEPDQKVQKLVTARGKIGTKTLDMQAREVDAAKACTPTPSNAKLNEPTMNPPDAKPTVHSGDSSFRGKKHHYNRSKKHNNDRTDQPKTPSQKIPENTNATGSKWSDANKSRGGGSFQSNKSGGPNRRNRAMTLNDNEASHSQLQDKPGYRSLRGDPRGNLNEKSNGPRKILTYNEGNEPAPSKQLLEAPVAEPCGFYDAAGNWYSLEMVQAHAAMAQHMQGGPVPHLMHGMTPHTGVPMPVAMPAAYHFSHPPPPFAREHAPHALNMAHFQHQSKQVNIPPPPCVVPKSAATTVQNASITTSADKAIPAINVISTIGPQGDKTIAKEEVHTALVTYDHRPAQDRIDSLLTTIMAQLQHLKIRIDPTRKPEHKIEPGEMMRYLDTAMTLCKMTQKSSEDFIEEYKKMAKHLNTLSSTKSLANAVSKQRDSDAKKKGGLQLRSQSMSPQRTYLNSSMEGAFEVSTSDTDHDDNNGDRDQSSRIQEFVIPKPEYAGYFIDTSNREQTIKDTNLRSEYWGPWWTRKQHHSWERANFGMGDEQDE